MREFDGDGPPDRYILADAAALIGKDGDVATGQSVLVRNGCIAAVGPRSQMPPASVIDCSGVCISPGFINGHTHVEDAGFAELLYRAPPGANVIYAPDGLRHRRMRDEHDHHFNRAVADAAQTMLASGTVMAADFCTGGARAVTRLRAALHASPIEWLHFTGHGRYPVQTAAELADNSADLPPGAIADIEEALEVADGFAPVHVNHTTDRGLRTIRRVVTRSVHKRLATHVAASSAYGPHSLRQAGAGDVVRAATVLAPDFVVHATYADAEDLRLLGRLDVPLVVCPRAMAVLGRPLPPYQTAVAAGVTVAMGTDNAMTSTPSLLDEMAFAARCYPCSPANREGRVQRIFRSATIDAARALGVDDRLGSVEPGKQASLVLFDVTGPALRWSQSPLASVVLRAAAADVMAVLIRGKLVQGTLPGGATVAAGE